MESLIKDIRYGMRSLLKTWRRQSNTTGQTRRSLHQASYLPARPATKVDPLVALRYE